MIMFIEKCSRLFHVFLILISTLYNVSCDSNVLSCGGFVKSDVDINFSLVEVKLYTTHGSIKYQTDCAPNTGYYLIPLYEKGEFVLKVEPPAGWSFEPTSVDLKVDGTTDKCSLGEDINFKFNGFSVSGKVVSQGQNIGPAGVKVSLTKSGSSESLQSVVTKDDGSYVFGSILPGDYEIKASTSEDYVYKQQVAKVTVKNDNMDVGASIVISGFKVKGSVQSEGTPIKGVNFVLFSVLFNKEDISNCEKAPLSGFAGPDGTQPLCYVTSKEDGSFVFPSLPVGEFYVIPFYKGEHIRFDVVPAKLEFRVHHAPAILEPVFQVAGFSVSGQVLNSEKGQGVSGADITVNGKHVTKTSNDGTYHLENMKTGEYKISVTKNNIYFEDLDVKITPNTPQLPVIIATGFSLCGQIVIDKLPESLSRSPLKRRVIIFPEGKNSEAVSIATETDGKFCTKVGKGKFIVKVHLTEEETKAGLLINPNEKVVMLTNAPILDVTFSQFRASISGAVTCLEKCGAIEVLLDPLGRGEKEKKTITESGKGGSFIFDKVMPGKYKVTLLHDSWCWKEKTLDVEVVDTDVSGIEFVQTGYILKCSISHEIKLNFAHEKKEGNVGSFNLNKGTNRFCLAQPGVYRLTMDSCHKFEKDIYTYDTSNPELLTLTAVKHLVEGQIETEQRVDDIVVTIISQTDKEPISLGPLKSVTPESKPSKDSKDKQQQDTGPSIYKFSHWARSGEKLEVNVKSKELLFSPPKTDITVQGDTCPGEVVKIIGKRGVFIIGHVKPALAGVNISVVTIDRSLMDPVYVETSATGDFKVGPLHGGRQYDVLAEKPGYVLVKEDGEMAVFFAYKLGEISVQVKEDISGQALSSVLLSLSGGKQYRSNNVTGENGSINFIGLSPGEYFLRPMMKEYRFEPASQMINVKEGTTVKIDIKAHRVAFSCYGYVTSLNGEAEPGTVVEAVGLDSCSSSQEESKTEQDGSYRIRGLQPKCTYEVKLKSDVNKHIDRSAPKSQLLKVDKSDFVDVNIIAFRRQNQMDISGNIVTPQDVLPSLKIKLYREENMDSPIATVNMEVSTFFYLPSPQINNERYILRLESTLSKSLYEYSLPEISFTANVTYRHFTFRFQPQRKSLEQELNQGSFLILPFTLLIAYVIYNYQKVLPVMSSVLAQVTSQAQAMMAPNQQAEPANNPNPPLDVAFNPDPAAKKKSKPRKTQ